jgi:hypothetical protein
LVASFWRSANTLAATFWPKAMPATLAGLSGTFSSIAEKAVSIRVFWPGYCRIKISRAAAAAAASGEALGSAGMSGVKRAYRSPTALIASDTDTCIMAKLRVHGLPATFTAAMTSMAVLFQSVTTSARASVVPEMSARPTMAVLRALIVTSQVIQMEALASIDRATANRIEL